MAKKSEIVFLGRFFAPRVLGQVMSDRKYNVGLSNHNFEISLLDGFRALSGDIEFQVLTVPAIFSYPHNNSNIFTRAESYCDNGIPVHSISVFNLAIINKIYIFFSLLFNLLRVYGKCSSKNISLIVNTPDWVNDSAIFLSRLFTFKNIRTTLIVPDLPEIMNTMSSYRMTLKHRIVAVFNRYGRLLADKYDSYVLLTDEMKRYFRSDAPKIVMEGLASAKWFDMPEVGPVQAPVILYTGTLSRVFGTGILTDAFMQLKNKNAELWICGAGDMSDEIEKLAESNKKVRFFGMLAPEKALELQRQATVLVNTRTSEGEYTKFSFPSKTMEYLAAGKPVVMNRLPGIPKEYFNYIFTPENESAAAFAATLDYVLKKSPEELQHIGEAGQRFIRENKNAKKQVMRIVKLASSNNIDNIKKQTVI